MDVLSRRTLSGTADRPPGALSPVIKETCQKVKKYIRDIMIVLFQMLLLKIMQPIFDNHVRFFSSSNRNEPIFNRILEQAAIFMKLLQ